LKEKVNVKPVRFRLSSEPERGLILKVEPKRADAARAEFGADLPAAGVTPVRFEIINHTARRYGFRGDAVELMTVQGSRETALALSAAVERTRKLAEAVQVEARLRGQQLSDTEIAPGSSVSGYLYFKAAAYRRARVVLTDMENDESEGFSVEF
jgi:CO/xanthine dehydrogenase Mo-binding subunit